MNVKYVKTANTSNEKQINLKSTNHKLLIEKFNLVYKV